MSISPRSKLLPDHCQHCFAQLFAPLNVFPEADNSPCVIADRRAVAHKQQHRGIASQIILDGVGFVVFHAVELFGFYSGNLVIVAKDGEKLIFIKDVVAAIVVIDGQIVALNLDGHIANHKHIACHQFVG